MLVEDCYVPYINTQGPVCEHCDTQTLRKPCQGAFRPFKSYSPNWTEEATVLTSFGEEKAAQREAGVEATDKRDNKASIGYDGWPKGRRKIATVINGKVVLHKTEAHNGG